jgi:hypothetical protein
MAYHHRTKRIKDEENEVEKQSRIAITRKIREHVHPPPMILSTTEHIDMKEMDHLTIHTINCSSPRTSWSESKKRKKICV